MKYAHLFLLMLFLLIGKISNGQDTLLRELPAFDRIKIMDNATVHLRTGSPQKVEIIGNSMPNIRTTVNDGTLLVQGPHSTLLITVPEIRSISIGGIGKVYADSTIRTPLLRISISGSGKVEMPIETARLEIGVSGMGKINLSGTAERAEINISGSGKLEAANLRIKSCETKISGVGKCYTDVTDVLDLRISGSGSFYYKTKPAALSVNISGIGKYGIFSGDEQDDEKTESTNRSSTDNSESANRNTTGTITVIGYSSDDDDDDFFFRWNGDSIFRMPEQAKSHWGGLDFGFNQLMVGNSFSTNLAPGYDYLELNSGKSININLNLFYHDFPLYKRHLLFTTGIGLTLNNYRFSDSRTLIADTNRTVAGFDFDKNGQQIKYTKNKLAVNYVTIPLLLQWNSREEFNNSFHVAAGLLLSYKFNSHLKLVYEEDGDREKTKRHDVFNINPFRYDFTMRFGYEYYTLYASYSLGSLFKENRGPSLHPFQVGINLFGW